MSGLTTLKATTTVKVVELPQLDLAALKAQIVANLIRDWHIVEPEASSIAQEDAAELARIASIFEEGDILEKRGNRFNTR
jgi:hypothetical protein